MRRGGRMVKKGGHKAGAFGCIGQVGQGKCGIPGT